MVTLNVREGETPSQEIIKAANATAAVTDATGRSISIRKPKTIDQMRIFELIGAENSNNDRYLGLATLAYCVTAIDGDPVLRPATKGELEFIVQRLDDDGFKAVSDGFSKYFSPKGESPDDVTAAIKNG